MAVCVQLTKTQEKWNDDRMTDLKGLWRRLATVEKKIIYVTGIMSGLGALLGALLGRFI